MLSNLSPHAAMPMSVSWPRLLLAVLALTAGLSACSSSKQSAPIEVRTPQQARPVARPDVARREETPAAGVTPPATASGRPAADKAAADKLAAEKAAADKAAAEKAAAAQAPQAGAIKQGSAESRPLTSPAAASPSAPATPPAAGAAATPASGTPAPAATLKSGPRGTKRPYSEATLAEMRQADGAGGTGAGTATAPAALPAAAAKPDGKAETKADAKADAKADVKAAPVTFAWPGKGKVLAGFSEPRQMGLSIDGALGDPVLSAADGKVIFSGVGPRGFGNLIIVKHEGELLSVYAHNKTLLVKDGQTVKKGQKIAELGDSGTDRPQLHFEIRRQGKPVDPRPYLPPR